MQIKKDAAFDYEIALVDGATNQYPRTILYNQAEAVITTLDLSHVAAGRYNANYTYTGTDKSIKAHTIVYSDSGHLTENTTYNRVHEIIDVQDYAVAGDEMDLIDDAITEDKFDETTAWPIKSEDANSTAIARTGADGDTLETLSDQVDDTQADQSTIIDHLTDIKGATWNPSTDTLEILYDKALAAAGYSENVADIMGGRWKIDTVAKQMIFYKADNITEVLRVDLLDSAGDPSTEEVYERTVTGG